MGTIKKLKFENKTSALFVTMLNRRMKLSSHAKIGVGYSLEVNSPSQAQKEQGQTPREPGQPWWGEPEGEGDTCNVWVGCRGEKHSEPEQAINSVLVP